MRSAADKIRNGLRNDIREPESEQVWMTAVKTVRGSRDLISRGPS